MFGSGWRASGARQRQLASGELNTSASLGSNGMVI